MVILINLNVFFLPKQFMHFRLYPFTDVLIVNERSYQFFYFLPLQKDTQSVYVIDEVGKMELFSQKFVQAVRDILKKPTSTVLATIPIPKGRPISFVEEIRSNKEAIVFQVCPAKYPTSGTKLSFHEQSQDGIVL